MPKEFLDTPPVSSFVGRDTECKFIKEFLFNPKSPILLVHGARGVGKTSLVSFVVSEYKDKFAIVWIDRSNILELLEDIKDLDEGVTLNHNLIKHPPKSEKNNSYINSAKRILINQPSEKPFLLIIDDFDEENNLSSENNGFALCNNIEKFVKHPNKVILTSRLHENGFRPGYISLEVGLLQKKDISSLVKNCFANVDKVVLVNQDLNDTCDFLWILSGGLAEFISRCIVPVATQKEFLLGRDPRYINIIHGFSQCYINEREQPRSLEGYDLTNQKHEKLLKDKLEGFEDTKFAGFILWKWFKLNLEESYTEDDLGKLLGINLIDNEIASKFHATLLELYNHRFVSRQFENEASKWILLPIIASYLQKYWTSEAQYWDDEAIYLSGFIESNASTPLRIIQHIGRVLEVLTWCNDHGVYKNAILLGESTLRSFEKIIVLEEIPESLDISILINIGNKVVAILEKQTESDTSAFLVEVLLTLAKFHSSSKIYGSQLVAHGFATKALNLAIEKKIAKEFDAIIVTAKTHIFLGELGDAGKLLEEIYSKNKVNEDWVMAVSLLIQALRIHDVDDWRNIYSWYRKIIETIEFHKKIDFALQAAIDASKYCYASSSLDEIADILTKAVDLLKQEKGYIKEFPFLSIQVLAFCAFAYERKKDLEQYKRLLQDASQACKEFGFEKHSIFNSIDKRLIVITEQGKDITLFDELMMITSNEPNILYGFDGLFENCPICRKPLGIIEIISCKSCNSRYHKTCLININVFSCLSCKTDLNFTTKE